MRGDRALAFVREHPWAITAEKLEQIIELVELSAAGQRFTSDEIAARLGAVARRPDRAAGAIQVVPVWGVLAHRMNLFTEISGGTSTEKTAAAIRQARQDPGVAAIVLDVDSPGGSVFGVEELAAEVYATRGVKPIVASANAWAASAAYWVASQADELLVTPSGQVGSIGVLAVHQDVSRLEAQLGVTTTLISAGRYKTEGDPSQPLGDEARQAIQTQVNAYYDAFVRAVARGRGVAQREVRSGFGEGRMVLARDALALGMVDGIETLDETLARVGGRKASGAPPAAARSDGTPRAPKVPPDEEGACPEGYEKRDDGMCHLVEDAGQAGTAAAMDRRRRRLRLFSC